MMDIGTKIRFVEDLYQDANDYSPLMLIAKKGEHGVIVNNDSPFWDYHVDGTVNKGIGVKRFEIERIK